MWVNFPFRMFSSYSFYFRPPSQDDADQVDTLEYIDLLEDPDNIPKYTGFFDYSEFWGGALNFHRSLGKL